MAMAALGYIMMGSMIVAPGITAGIHVDDIRSSINTAKQKQTEMRNKWEQVFQAKGKLDQQLKSDIVKLFTEINNNIKDAQKSHIEFQNTNKKIQYIGVTMVMFTFFLLLMKHYDLFDTINEIILSPFMKK